jgi:hypothetical protein
VGFAYAPLLGNAGIDERRPPFSRIAPPPMTATVVTEHPSHGGGGTPAGPSTGRSLVTT